MDMGIILAIAFVVLLLCAATSIIFNGIIPFSIVT